VRSRPTGTVSFLFTDIAGSTRLWETDRKGMAADPPEERMTSLEQTVASARAAGDMFIAANAMMVSYFFRESDDDPVALALLEQSVQILSELGFRHGQGHALIYWGGLTKDRLGSGVGESAVSEGAEILAGVGDIPCAVDASANLIEYLLENDRVEGALPRLDFAVRQGRTSPERYLGRMANLACHGAVAKGDFVTAAIILGHRIAAGDGKSSSSNRRLPGGSRGWPFGRGDFDTHRRRSADG